MRRACPKIRLVFVSLLVLVSTAWVLRAAELPAQISDEAFWTMISDFSNPMVISAWKISCLHRRGAGAELHLYCGAAAEDRVRR